MHGLQEFFSGVVTNSASQNNPVRNSLAAQVVRFGSGHLYDDSYGWDSHGNSPGGHGDHDQSGGGDHDDSVRR